MTHCLAIFVSILQSNALTILELVSTGEPALAIVNLNLFRQRVSIKAPSALKNGIKLRRQAI